MLQVLRPGLTHPHVELWEEFLRGTEHYMVKVDGFFDDNSVEATKKFQFEHNLKVDGWVGGQTWGKAIELGLDVFEDQSGSRTSKNWPPRTSNLKPINGTAGRQAVWGVFAFKESGFKDMPEAITITDGWDKKNIVAVRCPEIQQIPGFVYKGQLLGRGTKTQYVHRLVSESFLEMWKDWHASRLLGKVIAYGGDFVPRFVRGSRTELSNHAFGTAFDINAPWNGLRRTPALMGQRGCVRELVDIANAHGWWWGGHGWPPSYNKLDGMHFEATEKAIR